MIKAAIFDLDNTLLRCRSSERMFFKYLILHRIITVRDLLRMAAAFFGRLLRLQDIYIRENKFYLKGKNVEVVKDAAARFFRERLASLISSDAMKELEQKKKEGYMIILLSGTLDFLLVHFKGHCGADLAMGNSLASLNGHFTGEPEALRPYGHGKAIALKKLAEEKGIDLSESYAYADLYKDIHHMRLVGNPVAVNARGRFLRYAKSNNWQAFFWKK
jgi:HAD superfamily hydrolase (TIGR01490 family)